LGRHTLPDSERGEIREKIEANKKMESLSSSDSPIRPRLLSHDEEEEIVAAVRVGKQKVRGHRRRHLSTGDSEPIIRDRTNSLKTIYTAGRPPWYKSNGEQGTLKHNYDYFQS